MSRWRSLYSEFASTTGLHGYAYTADGGDRSRLEVGFWAAMCVVALVCTAAVCAEAFSFWSSEPIVTV